jgi:hypothetical protein
MYKQTDDITAKNEAEFMEFFLLDSYGVVEYVIATFSMPRRGKMCGDIKFHPPIFPISLAHQLERPTAGLAIETRPFNRANVVAFTKYASKLKPHPIHRRVG